MIATGPRRRGGPPGTDDLVLGLLRTDGLDVALPLAALREVVPCPDVLTDLPVTAVGLLGVMTLRASIVPVVDLALCLGRAADRDHRGRVVVVVAHDGCLVGLLVDEVRGMVAVPVTGFDEVTAVDELELFSRTFHHPEQGHVVTLLDAGAVLALPGVPVVRERDERAEHRPLAETARQETCSFTVVRCGAFLLALDVAFVHSTVPSPGLRPSPADGPTCLGVAPVAGQDVAVVDLLALLGLGSLSGTPLGCGLVLDLPDGQVVLGVGEMVGLHDVPRTAVVALPAAASPDPGVLNRVAEVTGVGTCLVVDGDALLALHDVLALSRVSTESAPGAGDLRGSGAPGAPAGAGATAGPPYLAYRADVAIATPLSQISEVLAYPEDLVPSRGSAEVLGLVLHRGVAVPVVCLATVLERTPPAYTPAARLLLVDVDGERLAYAVGGLHAILALAWVDEEQRRRPGPPLRGCPLVQLQTMDALVPELDLHALTRHLRGVDGPPVPEPREAQANAWAAPVEVGRPG